MNIVVCSCFISRVEAETSILKKSLFLSLLEQNLPHSLLFPFCFPHSLFTPYWLSPAQLGILGRSTRQKRLIPRAESVHQGARDKFLSGLLNRSSCVQLYWWVIGGHGVVS